MTTADGWVARPGAGRRRWITRRGRWALAGVAAVVAVSAAVDLGHRAGGADRAGDMRALVRTIDTDVAACNSSLRDSYDAYAAVAAGQTAEHGAAASIIAGDEPNCTPAANSDLFDLATTEAPATLRSYGLQPAITDVSTWAFPGAAAAISDLGTLLAHPTGPTAAAARRDLHARLAAMDGLAASAQAALAGAGRHLGLQVGPLDLGATSRLRAGGF